MKVLTQTVTPTPDVIIDNGTAIPEVTTSQLTPFAPAKTDTCSASYSGDSADTYSEANQAM